MRLLVGGTLACCPTERLEFCGIVESEVALPRINLLLCEAIDSRSICERRGLAIRASALRVVAAEHLKKLVARDRWTAPAFGVFQNRAISRNDGQAAWRGAILDHLRNDRIGSDSCTCVVKDDRSHVGRLTPAGGSIADEADGLAAETTLQDEISHFSLVGTRNLGWEDTRDVQEVVDIDDEGHGILEVAGAGHFANFLSRLP